MIQKIITSFGLVTLLFIGVILAQNAAPVNQTNSNIGNSNSQTNSNISNISFNTNRGMTNKVRKPKDELLPKPKSRYCKALSASDAEKIVGFRVEFREEKDEDGEVSCRYEKESSGDGLFAKFQTFADSQKAKRVLTLERETIELTNVYLPDHKSAYKTQIIQGVGEAAWIERVSDSITIWVQEGRTVFSIDVTENEKFSLPELKRVADKLAKQFALLTPIKSILNETIQNYSTDTSQPVNSSDSEKLNFPFNAPEESRNTPNGLKRSVACDYLTESDAKSLTDQSVVFYTSSTSENNLLCLYTQRNNFFPSVRLKSTTYQTTKQAKAAQMSMIKISELVNLRLNQDDSRIESVNEVGDAASLVTNGKLKNGASIYCQTGTTMFEIEVLDLKDKTVPLGVLKSIAKKVVENFSAAKAEQK